MLAVSPLRNTTNNDEKQGEMESTFHMGKDDDNFPDFTDGSFLDCINFDDLFTGINEADMLPDLEMDPEILAEFSTSGGEESEVNAAACVEKVVNNGSKEDERISKKNESKVRVNSSSKETEKRRKSSPQCKNPSGKKKTKVDWTPELHRRFVQAVEQLGVDKAVPSRILELMGIDCLTRHNIASHLQKYRSHKKHLLAREAEAASWNKRRQMYAAAVGRGGKNSWMQAAPTMGFPLVAPMHHYLIRPLHVWGDPTLDKCLLPIWPKNMPHSRPHPPPPPAAPTWPPADPLYWRTHPHIPSAQTPETPCFAQPVAGPTRCAAHPHVPGIPPHSLYMVDLGIGAPTGQSGPRPLFDLHPSKESIDAALGDVLSKPWLPLPIGLKPLALDSVMVELQRQGIPKIPPNGTKGVPRQLNNKKFDDISCI